MTLLRAGSVLTIVLAAGLMLLGCAATVPLAPATADLAAKSFKRSQDKASIYVARKGGSLVGPEVLFKVSLDGEVRGRIAAGTYFLFKEDPGTHTVAAIGLENEDFVTLETEAGKNYFLSIQAKFGLLSARTAIERLDNAEGRKFVLATKRAAAAVARRKAAPRVEAKARVRRFPESPVTVQFRRVRPRPDDVAVIIGNADYKKLGRDIPDVTPAYADARGMKRYVIEALGIREDNIIFIKDAKQADMLATFGTETNHKGQLFDWLEPGRSRVFVYYSGHGAPGGREGSSYLVPADAQASRLELNGYPLRTLYRNLGKLPAKSVTVVLEACFSGVSQGGSVISRASPVYLKSKSPPVPPNVTVISAGGANQMASWEKNSSHSLFTKYFLKGMSGEADARPYGNGDGRVGYSELKRYLKKTVTRLARRYYGRDQVVQIVNAGGR